MDNISFQKKVSKPWGSESWLTSDNLPYTSKILHVTKGSRLSLQYHDLKDETLSLVSGKVSLVIGPDAASLETVDMLPEVGYHVAPNVLHRIEAIEDSVLVEASLPQTGTTFRVQDDYGRTDEHLA